MKAKIIVLFVCVVLVQHDADAATIIHRGIENVCKHISLCRDAWVGCGKVTICKGIINALGFQTLYKMGQYIPLQNTFNTYNTYGTNAAYGTYGAYGTNVAHVPNGAYGPSGANGANTQNQMPPPIPLTSISEIVSRLSTDKVEQDMMGQQISQQFGKMSQIVRYNAVRKAYGMNNPVRTFQYAPYNGSCLLDALSQQLWPTSHIGIASTMLRKRVVNYIKADSKRFRPIIETRLKHEYEVVNHGKQISAASLRMKVMKFTSDLSKQSYYGGFETLVAVKETQRSNIFELNAHGAPRFIDGFNHTYTQTLCVYHWSVTAPSDKWEVFTKSYVLHNPYESVISIF